MLTKIFRQPVVTLIKKQNFEKKSVATVSVTLLAWVAVSGLTAMKSMISSTVSSPSPQLMTAGRFRSPWRLNSSGGLPGGTVATRNCVPGPPPAARIISTCRAVTEYYLPRYYLLTMNTRWHAGHAPYFFPSNPLLRGRRVKTSER